jgi:multiple sugar transport system ATP-binding protein
MRTELIKLHNKLETTFVYVTHDQTEAMTMGDRIVVMNHAVVQQVDTPQNLYDFPCNMFVAGFIGSPQMNFIDAILKTDAKGYFLEIDEDKLYIPAEKATDAIKEYVDKPVKLGVRPEDIYDDEAFRNANADSVISTYVEVSELMGSEVYLYLKYSDYTLTARVAPTTKSRTGDSIKVGLDMNNIHLFDVETENTILN